MLSLAVLSLWVHTVNSFYKTLAFGLKVKVLFFFFFSTKHTFIKFLPYCRRYELEGTEFMVLVFYYIPRLSKQLVLQQGNKGDNSAGCHSSFHSTSAKTSTILLPMNEIPLNL